MLVITGGTSGIGAAMVHQFALQRCPVVFNGSRPQGRVDTGLLALPNTIYVQGDAGDPETATRLLRATHEIAVNEQERLLVVANAGIERPDTDAAGVEGMRRLNVDGTRHLLDAFAEDLQRTHGLFVGVSSIVATMNVILPGNVEYHATKVAVANIVRGIASTYPNVHGITLSPGAIQTPMTESSPVYGLLLRLAAIAAVSDRDLRAGLAPFAGGEDQLGTTASNIFTNVLGAVLDNASMATTLKAVLSKDLEMKGNRAQLLAAKAAQDPNIRVRMARILSTVDILIPPETVAKVLWAEFNNSTIPNGDVLRAWQSQGQGVAPIARLLAPLKT